MPEHSEDFAQVRERIAEALLQRNYPGASIEVGDDESDLMLAYADTVLDALGLKQVAWLGPYGVVPGGVHDEPAPGWLPVYVLRPTQSGSEGQA